MKIHEPIQPMLVKELGDAKNAGYHWAKDYLKSHNHKKEYLKRINDFNAGIQIALEEFNKETK
jgi:hypothetical protein